MALTKIERNWRASRRSLSELWGINYAKNKTQKKYAASQPVVSQLPLEMLCGHILENPAFSNLPTVLAHTSFLSLQFNSCEIVTHEAWDNV